MSEIQGELLPFEAEFKDTHLREGSQRLLGNPVYVVDGDSHPDCVIYGRVVGIMKKPLPPRRPVGIKKVKDGI